MIITCEKCRTKYKIADDLLGKPELKVRCHKCSHRFIVYRAAHAEDSFLLQDEVHPDYSRVIAISNQKGGVAKTTTTLNLGAALAKMGKRVLLIDFDVQANLTILLGFRKTRSFYEVLTGGVKNIGEAVVKTKYANLSLLPSSSKMALLKKKYLSQHNFEYLLRDKLRTIQDSYDHVLIDTPPSIEFFTLNALVAANMVIVPSTCEYLSMHGVSQIHDIINVLKKSINQEVECKVLITMYDERNTSEKVICDKLRQTYRDNLFRTVIGKDDKMQESHIVNAPISHYAEKSSASLQYMQLAQEIVG
ncbi:MAG: chromosome partitioning protein [Candidatus Electronema aureum]|jgi:chromosome partitioning protein|uniref:Chromosome partitioning protein n=1 Tax=Candidatus Electronema aureum TaxID=2005002 RepID=A0A521G3H1_9BACT|nr:zinc-ribbon domain-containing protein [Desulfobulbus sp. F5]TAA75557.1 MAG: chromosome partitioning protein [Candidatus Electronema aureum]